MTIPDRATPPRRLRLRYAGTCVVCGVVLEKGTEALFDSAARTVRCLACPRAVESETSMVAPPPAAAESDTGTAGASARGEYERRKEMREGRIKERYGRRLGRVVLAVTREPQSTRAWAQGARGEEELARSLAAVPGIAVLHDRAVAGTRGNIDHIVAAPAGIFVVDAKNYKGGVAVGSRGGLFRTDPRLYVGFRDCSHLADNMGWQVNAVQRALDAAAVDPRPSVVPVLCFVHAVWPIFSRPDSFRDVRLASPRSFRKLLAGPAVLDAETVDRLARILADAFPPK